MYVVKFCLPISSLALQSVLCCFWSCNHGLANLVSIAAEQSQKDAHIADQYTYCSCREQCQSASGRSFTDGGANQGVGMPRKS